MKAISISISILILTLFPTNLFSLSTTKVYPDFQIQVYFSDIQGTQTTGTDFRVMIRVRNMIEKEWVKGWNKNDNFSDFSINGTKTLTSLSKTHDALIDAYTQWVEAPFRIAMIIQDAGYIPVIQFKEVDQYKEDGTFLHTKTHEPSGNTKYARANKIVSYTLYYPDYIIKSGIEPEISGSSVTRWKTRCSIHPLTSSLRTDDPLKAWTADETDILKFDILSEKDKSEFVIYSDNWIDAQKKMFVNTYRIITKLAKSDQFLILEAQYDDINFVTENGVQLIDLSNGFIPSGEMIEVAPAQPLQAPVVTFPLSGETNAPYTTIFAWDPVQNAEEYKIELWRAGFATVTKSTNTNSIVWRNLVRNATYYWTIQAISNSDPSTNSPVNQRSFKTTNTNEVMRIIGGGTAGNLDTMETGPHRFEISHTSNVFYSAERVKDHATSIKLPKQEYVRVPYSSLWDIGGSDFEIEFDIYANDLDYKDGYVKLLSSYGSNSGWEIGFHDQNVYLYKYYAGYTTEVKSPYANSFYNRWINIRINVNYSTTSIYLDGTLAGTHSEMRHLYSSGSSLYIGGNPEFNPNYAWEGYIDNLIIRRGN